MPKPGSKQAVCSCGFKQEAQNVTLTESQKQKTPEIAVIEKETTVNTITDADCNKCANKQAEYWEVQTRAADEPATRFYKCTKCKHTWREYK